MNCFVEKGLTEEGLLSFFAEKSYDMCVML